MRKRIFEIVQKARPGDGISRAYDIILVCTAVLSVTPLLFGRDGLEYPASVIVNIIDIVTVYILFFDYIMRWLTHDFRREQLGRKGDWRSFLYYPLTPLAIIDLLAILPSITVLPSQLMFLRLLRLFKIFRFSKAFASIGNVFKRESRIFLSMGILFALYIFVAALIMYIAEPKTFENFITALYWSTTSLVTIGYGDLAPTSDLGRFINIISALVGVALIALPTAVITTGFMNEVKQERIHKSASMGAIREAWEDIKKFRPFERIKRLKAWLNQRQKVKVYLMVIVICILLDQVLPLLSALFPVIPSVEYLGPVVCAVLLEPAAGVIVAFVTSMGIALKVGSASQILQFFLPALLAVVFGELFSRGRHPGIIRTAVVLVASSVLGVLLTCLLWWLMDDTSRALAGLSTEAVNTVLEGDAQTKIEIFASSVVYYLVPCSVFAIVYSLVWPLIKGKKLDPHTHYNYSEDEPKLACQFPNSYSKTKFKANKLGSDILMRSTDEVAADLLVTPNLVEAYLDGKELQQRETDQALCPYEQDVESLVNEWLATRASEDLQYLACDGCGRWYHIDNLHACVHWDKNSSEKITTFMCSHCRTHEQEI